jgi:peptidoglycan-associated lipoprotein
MAMTEAKVAPRPAPPPVAVSPNIAISDELLRACNVRFDDVATAPKFELDRSALGSRDGDALKQIADCVIDGPLAGRSLDLVGRADPRGTDDYNLALGERRVSSVREGLASLGMASGRIFGSSRGEADATGTDEAGWQRDRRVDILLR